MRRPIYGKSASTWLTDGGANVHDVAEILNSYEKGTLPRLYTYQAPHLFLRFHGANSRRHIHQPNYWADGSTLSTAIDRANQFEGFLTEDEIRKVAKTHYRDITAICHNWSSLESDTLWIIELRGSETVEGLEGATGAQPTHAATSTSAASTSMLAGGAIQVYLNPGSPFLCTPVNW